MATRLISAKEVLRKRFTDPEAIKNHLLECAQRIISEQVEKALNFKVSIIFETYVNGVDDIVCFIDIPLKKLEEIYDHEYFPHEELDSWLAKYNWKLKDLRKDRIDVFVLESINCMKEDFGLTKEEYDKL